MSQSNQTPLILVLAVGLTKRLIEHAPRIRELAERGWVRTLGETIPSVTCSAQATLLTGKWPDGHGVVGNGWLFRETGEVRFWQQSNRLLEAEPFYETASKRAEREGKKFRAAKLFWWFNQGAKVDVSVTPKPFYGADGNKAFAVDGQPRTLVGEVEQAIGPFPFPAFWGPRAGLASTEWIARCAGEVLVRGDAPPDLTMVYLPHLDYEPQRVGPGGCDMARLTGELDGACEPLFDAAKRVGARVWVVSEYGHCDVSRVVYLNRELRRKGWLEARPGPFGESLDTFGSRAFAVCDHQVAHVYVRNQADLRAVAEVVGGVAGVARVFSGEERGEVGLDHARAGELVVLSERDSWFAYPYWLEDSVAPDFARTVDIHRKPGYDPCELFLDPALWWGTGRVIRRLVQKKLGFRTLFDVIPLDAAMVKGSHGLAALDDEDRPVLIGDGAGGGEMMAMTGVRDLVLGALGYGERGD